MGRHSSISQGVTRSEINFQRTIAASYCRLKLSQLEKFSKLWIHVIEKKVSSLWDALNIEKENDDLYLKSYRAFNLLKSLSQEQKLPTEFIANVVNILLPWKKTKTLLDEINLWVETSKNVSSIGQRADVQLITLQGAKGLQANVVCIIGLEEGTLPKNNSTEEELAEQSRLMYVSMTRAIDELHLFHARKRSQAKVYRQVYKKGMPPNIQQSSFLTDIPSEFRKIEYHR